MVKLTATQTYKVVNYLLANPHTSQVEISKSLKVSRDLVSYVVESLKAPGIVSQEAREHLELKEPLRLLEALSIERPLSKLVIDEIRVEQSEVSDVERMVRNCAAHPPRAGRYTFTCFSALSKYIEYYIAYPEVHVYSSNPEELSKSITRGRGDVVVKLVRPDSDLIFRNTRWIKDLTVVEPVQAVIDLFCLGGAGRDGAMKLYQSLIEPNDGQKETRSEEKDRSKRTAASSRKSVLRRTA